MHHYENQNYADHTQGMPALFAVFKSVLNDDVERIAPHLFRKFKRHVVFNTVFKRLVGIPLKLHATIQ